MTPDPTSNNASTNDEAIAPVADNDNENKAASVSSSDATNAEPNGTTRPSASQSPPNPPELPKTGDAPAESGRERGRLRRTKWALVGIGVLVLFGPQLATWGLGRRWIEQRLAAETHLDLGIGGISASWWGPIVVRDVQVQTTSGHPVSTLDELRTGKSLWSLLWAGVDKGEIRLIRPSVTLELNEGVLAELQSVAESIRPDRGLLKRIIKPHKDTKLRLVVEDGTVSVKPNQVAEWQTIVRDGAPVVQVTRTSGDVAIQIEPGDICQFEVSPTLCDLGLEYVLPVLAGAVDTEGICHFRLHSCDLDLSDIAASEVSGELFVDTIRAEVDGPFISQITSMVAKAADLPEGPLTMHITENCPVEFAFSQGVVYHEGLKFGMPRVLPALVLQTRGGIALDQSMDLYLEAVLPFDKMGDAALLQKLGAPALSIPIGGTLTAPKVDVGEGQVVKGLVRDVVQSLTDDKIDPTPILDQISELGLLQKLRERREAKAAENSNAANPDGSNGAGGEDGAAGGEDGANPPSDGTKASTDDSTDDAERPRLLERIRKRGLLRRRDRE